MRAAPSTIVVTGRRGQIASALGRTLTQAGFDVVLIGRPECDLVDAGAVRRAIAEARPALVINAAAYTAVDKAEDDSGAAFAVNRDGAGYVAEAAAQVGAPIIHFSTDYVFDGSKGAPYVESDPTRPLGVYGRSKLAGEAAVAEANSRAIILRTAWVCSSGGANFLNTMLRLAASRDELGVVNDQRGAPSFAADIAGATAQIAANILDTPDDPSLYGTFHLTSAGETTWCGFARSIFEGSAVRSGPHARVKPIATADYPTRAQRPADSRLDCSLVAARHGVVMPDWRDGLERCLDELFATPMREERAS
ncbi:dTDP-4-dehydrorhamnose reductase [Methylocapsa sp. S129]|uniref:dTDP-4-dehydrorhamnose reductase n=1 Tax=Methylocapsa sp. S129 TaxID=1641869 RepID=UPI001FF00804|nr:dTDP-4-dehydrorhamnose reductase [Methylocapsa sp. S129]